MLICPVAVDANTIIKLSDTTSAFQERFQQTWDWMYPSPMAMNRAEAASSLEYRERLGHLMEPDPCEGEAGKARSCFLLRTFAGKREIFWVDTETQEVVPLSFLVSYEGQPGHYPNIEIGTPKG